MQPLRISNFARPYLQGASYRAGRGLIDASICDALRPFTARRANFTTHKRDVGRESQRPCVTSPSNIDLFATTSMLIPHSNSRSSCGARARFSRAVGPTDRGERGPLDGHACPGICRVARGAAEERTRSRFADAERKIRHMTGPRHTYGAPILSNAKYHPPLLFSRSAPLSNSINRDF